MCFHLSCCHQITCWNEKNSIFVIKTRSLHKSNNSINLHKKFPLSASVNKSTNQAVFTMADGCEKKSEVLDVVNESISKERAVFSLLQQKKRSAGTFKFGPSSALQQVKQFLPQLQEANAKLEGDLKDPNVQARYNIEHIDEEAKELIEMNLAVYEDSGSEEDNYETNGEESSSDDGPIDESNLKLPGVKKKSNMIQEVVLNNHVSQ